MSDKNSKSRFFTELDDFVFPEKTAKKSDAAPTPEQAKQPPPPKPPEDDN